jgi:hypothetical protein
MKRYLLLAVAIVMGAVSAMAQQNDAYEEFRRKAQSDYNSFRDKVVEDYANFLEGVWSQYESFKAPERYSDPKPQEQPSAPVDYHKQPAKADVPQPKEQPKMESKVADVPPPAPVEKPVTMTPPVPKEQPKSVTPPQPKEQTKSVTPPAPKEQPKSLEQPKPAPAPAPAPESAAKNVLNKRYMYHSLKFEVPYIAWGTLPNGSDTKVYANLWKTYASLKVEKEVLPHLQKVAKDCNFNDWFFFECLRSYVDSEMASMAPCQRMSLTHYLMSKAGYDVRIAVTKSGAPMLLVAINQNLYSRRYATLGDKRFYIFYDNIAGSPSGGGSFYTCDIPQSADCGRALDLIIREEPKMPYKAHKYSLDFGGIHVEGEINANVMPLLYRYPQMDIGCYAESVVSAKVEREVTAQLASQLTSSNKLESVNKLLQFVQRAFSYATDDAQHGFEKPYFFEELLYYPKSDCEDRSIFYSYLLKSVLGVENHLIRFPGHETVAVNLGSKIDGDNYTYEGRTFYISDPTYMGAVTGMAMKSYKGAKPIIDYIR